MNNYSSGFVPQGLPEVSYSLPKTRLGLTEPPVYGNAVNITTDSGTLARIGKTQEWLFGRLKQGCVPFSEAMDEGNIRFYQDCQGLIFDTPVSMVQGFGELVGRFACDLLPGNAEVHEFGPGTGRFARDILKVMPGVNYVLHERSTGLRQAQRRILSQETARTRWYEGDVSSSPIASAGSNIIPLGVEFMDDLSATFVAKGPGGQIWEAAIGLDKASLQNTGIALSQQFIPAGSFVNEAINRVPSWWGKVALGRALKINAGAINFIGRLTEMPNPSLFHMWIDYFNLVSTSLPHGVVSIFMGDKRWDPRNEHLPFHVQFLGGGNITSLVDLSQIREVYENAGFEVLYLPLGTFLAAAGVSEHMNKVLEGKERGRKRILQGLAEAAGPATNGYFSVLIASRDRQVIQEVRGLVGRADTDGWLRKLYTPYGYSKSDIEGITLSR